MRIAGDYEFFARPEWTALENAYQLAFAEQVTMDSTLMYSALAESRVDVISAFSTDGRIPAFDLQVLDDPRGALPPYDALVLTRRDGPAGLRDALRALDGAIGSEAMRAANQRVDLEGEPVMNVAAGLAETIRKTEEER